MGAGESRDTIAAGNEGTGPVREAHRFDTQRLADFMRQNVDEGIRTVEVEQFKGGQSNPTFLVRANGKRYVMRRKPPGKLLPSAHAVDREYRVITALAKTDVPVAKSYALCQDDSVIGTAFYIMDYVQGRILWDPRLPDTPREKRRPIFEEMNRIIGALHNVDYKAIGLADYGKSGSYFVRQIDRWTKQYRAAETEKIEAMDNLIEWLPKHIPADDQTRIVHGDYRLDNMIFHPTEPRVLAVLDWELSTLGHPLADFAYHCMTWRFVTGPTTRGLAGTDLADLNIPTEREYVDMYLRRVGRTELPEKEWEYYMAFNMFRLVGIVQGIMARALQGNASSANALEAGKRAGVIAQVAWQQVERMMARGN